MKLAIFFLRQRVMRRPCVISCLFAMLLFATFAPAQDFIGLESPAKHPRLLPQGLASYLPKHESAGKDPDGDIDGVPSIPSATWLKRWEYFDESRTDAPRVSSANSFPSPSLLSPNAFGRVDTAWVRHFAAGVNPSLDVATDIAIDASSNVYVTGYSSGTPWGVDYVTIKYNASGAKLWEARYNGPGNGDDLAYALTVDAAGNVYVTGVSYDVTTSDDYTTIKYNNAGVQQWVARYNGVGNSFDEATALAVDMAGNVYVTGRSWGVGTLDDYATIKYNSAGAEQWVMRYSGPGDFYDVATALAIDTSGNVYVTGWSRGVNTGSRFVTIKYNGTGVQQWLAHYTGPCGFCNETAVAIAVDAASNVYVTGGSPDLSSGFDYATLKYSSNGVQQWVARYNGPGNGYDVPTALAVDVAGNVYVTGQSEGAGTSADYATIRYNSAGVEQWVVRYDRTGSSRDVPSALALDSAGYVYVTGESEGAGNDDYVTIKYDSAGVQQWETRYSRPGNYLDEPPALAVDPTSGDVHVAGQRVASTSLDYVTVKMNNAGSIQWIVTYNGPHESPLAQAEALAVDAAGDVCVTGWILDPATNYDYVTIKYSSAGDVLWIARYDAGNNLDIPTAMAVDSAGNVFVTGRSRLPFSSASDYATIKYNRDGVQQWVARYNRPGNNSDVPEALAVDAAGNVYVTGSSRNTGTDYDYATIKYNSNGVEQWVSHYNGPANATDLATALAIDTACNVYVTGYGLGLGTDYDYATIKYDNAGAQQWENRYNGLGNARDEAIALAVDPVSGDAHVTGRSRGLGTDYDYATIKYNFAGVQQWVARYNGPANNWDVATALGIDAANNIYVTGESYDSLTDFDFATIKYNSAGVQQWLARYDGPESSWDRATALALDDEGNVYVTGTIGHEKRISPGGAYILSDYGTIKYNSAGVAQWVASYNGPANDEDTPIALAVDAARNVYVTGYSYGWSKATNWRIYTTIKYEQKTPPPDAPTLASPPNGVVNQPTTLTLRWNPSTGAQTYRLQVSTSSDFATTVIDDSTIAVTSRQIGPLANNTTYYWRVNAKNIGGTSAWSEVWRFTTVKACLSDGDLNNDGRLTPADALCAFEIFLNGGNLPPDCDVPNFECELIAADVNCDGNTTPGDALAIFQRFLQGLPPQECFAKSSLTKPLQQARAYRLAIHQQKSVIPFDGTDQEIVKVTCVVDDPIGLHAFGLTLSYAEDELDFVKLERTALTAAWKQLEARRNDSGVLMIGGYDDKPVANTSAGELFRILFAVKKSSASPAEFTLSNLVDDFREAQWTAAEAELLEVAGAPETFELRQNLPNPLRASAFNPTTTIEYALPQQVEVKLVIFDLMGRHVRTLVDQHQPAGRYAITWDGRNEQGQMVTSGVYLYQLRAGNFVQTRRMALVR